MEASAAQRRLLGLGAFLVRLNRNDVDVLGGTYRGHLGTLDLVRGLGVTSTDEARAFVERALARAEAGPRPSWDLGRAASWAGSMYAAFFLEADEAWDFVRRADAIARRLYEGWEPFAIDYVAGRQEFIGKRGKGKDDEVAVAEWLLTSKKSPWVRAPWDTDTTDAPPLVHLPNELRVGGRRATHASLGAALDEAAAGDVIVLAKGSYEAATKPARDVTLRAERVGAKVAPVIVEANDHVVFADRVAVRVEGLAIRGTNPGRAAIAVRDGGAVVLEGCTIGSKSHGIAVRDETSSARLHEVVVDRPGDIGIMVFDRAVLHADNLRVTGGRLGVSVEASAEASLRGFVSTGAEQAGLLVTGHGKAEVREARIERAGWTAVQVSERGSLTLEETAVTKVPTGLLVKQASLVVRGVALDAKKNGLELQSGAEGTIEALTVTRAGGSAVFVAEGATLALVRSALAGARFDGVTCAGTFRGDDLTVRDTKRAAFFVEDGGRAYVARSVATNVGMLARAGEGAELGLASVSCTGSRLGVAVEGAKVAIESAWITDAREHALQIDGGSLVAGYVTVEGENESPLVATGGRATIATSRLEGRGDIQVDGADVTLRRVTVVVDADCAAAVHGGRLAIAHARIEGKGANGVEAVGGELVITASSVVAAECAVVTDGSPIVRVQGSDLASISDVAFEVLGKSDVTLVDVRGASETGEVLRIAKKATVRGRVDARVAEMLVDLDGEGPLPFELLLHDGPVYTLVADPGAVLGSALDALVAAGGTGNGHEASAYAVCLAGAAFDEATIVADPEASLVSFASRSRDALLAFAAAVRHAEDATIAQALRAVVAAPP